MSLNLPPLNPDSTAADPGRSYATPEELLRSRGIDPSAWGGLNSVWVKQPDLSIHLSAPVESGAAPLTDEDIEAILAGYPAGLEDRPVFSNDDRFLVCIADQQIGKPDGGGTPVLIEAFHRSINAAAMRIVRETDTGHVGTIVLAHLGDACEGAVSQNGKLRHDLGVTEEFRLARRLLVHAIGVLAPYCDRMIVGAVPSNHGEARRDVHIAADDNWCVEVVHAAQDVLEGRAEYAHVDFYYPDSGEISVAFNVGSEAFPIWVGMAHGHVGTRQPNQVIPWILGQKANQKRPQPLQGCDLILTGHYHHYRVEDSGYGWFWAMAPALESGSDWYRFRTGKDSIRGMLTGWIVGGPQPLIRDEVV